MRNPFQLIAKFFDKHKELKFLKRASTEEAFTHIYESNKWGEASTRSGKGSTLDYTRPLRAELPTVLQRLNTEVLLDIPCGDFHWMQHVELPVKHYIGADIVNSLIAANTQHYGNSQRTFLRVDLLQDQLPEADTILCRECLVHLSIADINRALCNIKNSGATYLLTTSFPDISRNADIVTGKHRRLNFCAAPWSWPAPLGAITEQGANARRGRKLLGVWKIDEITIPAISANPVMSANPTSSARSVTTETADN